ncbi:MAG TPA: DUF6545 domain-containing protein [Nonomuraea sp.]|nr:DUF6545 domain-containing protein [Nonomuraea sp.]
MADVLVVLCLTIVELVALSRLPGAGRSFDRTMIMVALLSGSVCILLEQTPVEDTLAGVGISRTLCFIVQCNAGLLAGACVLTWTLYSWRALGRSAWWARLYYPIAAIAVPVVTLSAIAISYNLDADNTYAAVGEQRATWPELTVLAAFETGIAVMFSLIAIMWVRLGRRTQPGWLRLSLNVMMCSSAGVVARPVYTMAYLLPQIIDIPAPPVAWSATLSTRIDLPSYTLGFIGISLPAIEQIQRWVRPRRAVRLVGPLWKDLSVAFPDLVRMRSADTPVAELQARDLMINEGLLQLREYSSPQALAEARSWAAAAGWPAKHQEAAAIARWVMTTLNELDSQPRRPQARWSARWSLGPRAGDPEWLLEVARAYNHLRRRPRPHRLQEGTSSWQQDRNSSSSQ